MRFGQLEINPARSPGVLDTATWDRAAVWASVRSVDDGLWRSSAGKPLSAIGDALASRHRISLHVASEVQQGASRYALASLADGQDIVLRLGPTGDEGPLGEPVGVKEMDGGDALAVYPTDATVIDRFLRRLAPEAGPRALGAVPRLGIGTRMTTAVWPAIWQVMRERSAATNAIQNSVRELYLLDTLLSGQPPETNTAFGFGTIETGYTGSTFEGLWLAGALAGLKADNLHGAAFGADADHIQVKRGAQGLARAKRLLDAARYYSFYTLDVSDVLDYAAIALTSAAAAEALLATAIPDAAERSALVAYHRQAGRLGGYHYAPTEAELGRLVGKYWAALSAVEELHRHLLALKDGAPFDLELSIDEHPNEIPTFDCLTTEAELCFVLLEARRRGIPLTHVAPNYGVEKGTDYRCPDGLPGLAARSRSLGRIAEEFGVMPDYHSGDDLGKETRRVIGRAIGGRCHFKVSPMLQLLFGEVLSRYDPALFRRWWADALAYAQRAAAGGSTFAADCLRQDAAADLLAPSDAGLEAAAHGQVFHQFSFAFVGRRDASGAFLNREEFYSLSPAFYRAYQDRLVAYLGEIAEDLY